MYQSQYNSRILIAYHIAGKLLGQSNWVSQKTQTVRSSVKCRENLTLRHTTIQVSVGHD